MKLEELIKSIKEENLSKDDLEKYRDELSYLFVQLQIEMADLEKEEALFMDSWIGPDHKASVPQKKVAWKVTKGGQRLIVLKRYCLATKELLNSLKSRLYSIY